MDFQSHSTNRINNGFDIGFGVRSCVNSSHSSADRSIYFVKVPYSDHFGVLSISVSIVLPEVEL